MKRVYTFLSFLVFISIIVLLQSCNEESTQPQNQAPQIQSVSANPSTSSSSRLPAGGTVTFLVTATDPDRDPLSYTWECSDGSFTEGQNTNTVKWQSPITQSTATYTITVNVSDGAQISKQTVPIYVDKATPGINVTPTSLNFSANIDTLQMKIFNIGTGTLNWQIQNLVSWMSASPSSGSLAQPTDTATSKIIVTRGTLTAGNYTQTINVVNTNNTTNKVAVMVSMVVPTYGYVEGHTYYSGSTIPVSGVTVTIDNVNYTTNNDGYYRLNNITLGNKLLTATKTGYDSYQTNINVVQGKNTKEIAMTSALYTHNLYGTIKSTSTQLPLQNVTVTVLNDDGTNSQLQTTSDASGYYQVPTVPQGQRFIKYSRPGFYTFNAQIYMSNTDYQYDTELQILAMLCVGTPSVNYLGKDYNTVQIGNQCWLRENLDVGTKINGSQDPSNNGTIEKYCYSNDQANCTTYGGLYQWDEAMQYSITNGARGICPPGWHIPTKTEFDTLKALVNQDGNSLKAIGQGFGSGAGNNNSFFSALLAGLRYFDGSIYGLGEATSYWSSTESSSGLAFRLTLTDHSSEIPAYIPTNEVIGFSIRCLRD